MPNIGHTEDITVPFSKWVKDLHDCNCAIFDSGYITGDNVHLTINHLKHRIRVREENGLNTIIEAKALLALSCNTCVQQGCTVRGDECEFPIKPLGEVQALSSCVRFGLEPCEPYDDDDEEYLDPKYLAPRIFTIETEYYFDVTPNNKQRATFEIQNKSRYMAVHKALSKWPNSTLINSKEKIQ